ncbi:NmrA family protein [Anaeromyxobacter sp. K]|uniref:SDR family oxidoreductase n=1 Tax=Anaeromyxobacter sp. (strain K) TaxID=447217 RepID=UPI00015F9D9D|nr:NAD(P)H-binding protein [Anaeromyxobacter sp. K]ACG74538.1 NmrA family protein [Anaeromyxobacter sp. K]
MTARLLVTGATGTLGRHVVARLRARPGVTARILSRSERSPDAPAGCEWVRGNLLEDDLGPALLGVDAVLHLASAKGAGDPDVRAVGRLLAAAEAARVRHLTLISIVGCDAIPLPFYASKQRIEAAVRGGRVPWSIVRVAQFHSFVDRMVRSAATLPLPTPIVADLRFQPVDEREVADHLLEVVLGPPLGDAPELAGPEVLTLGDLAATWLAVTGRPASLVPVSVDALGFDGGVAPAPAPWTRPTLEGYRAAFNTPRGPRSLGKIRFADWLRERESAAGK